MRSSISPLPPRQPAPPERRTEDHRAAGGPYVLSGNLPVASKQSIVSEHGEPLTWKKHPGHEAQEKAIEPDLPVEVAVIPDGPLWVTGGIEVTGSDGAPLERCNRVTLCRCGHSASKPLCDGSHKEAGFTG